MGHRWCKFFSECKQKAVYRIPHSNLALCKDHFLKNVEKRVKKLVEKKHMFHPGANEKVLLALSGGKDSQVLLTVLKNLYPEGVQFEGLYIELGIAQHGYSADSGVIAAELCRKLGVPFHVINVKEDYGLSIDDINWAKRQFALHKWPMGKMGHFKGECSYCGMLKRYSINKYAAENDFFAVLTGHNLTDESTALLNNFLNMDLMFLSRPGPMVDSKHELLVPRGKPLFYVSEEEVMMYAYFAGIPHLPTECPYSLQSPNQKLKAELKEIESHRRGNMISLMRRYYKVMQPVLKAELPKKTREERRCSVCGMPTFSKKCSFCRTLNTLVKKHREARELLAEVEVTIPDYPGGGETS